MVRNGEVDSPSRMRMLVVKGSFAPMGGAERDIIRNLPALSKKFAVTVATLESSSGLEEVCEKMGIPLMTPRLEWTQSSDVISRVLDSDYPKALECWKSVGNLTEEIEEYDCIHITSGDGSLAILEIIPEEMAIHLHLLEPHRGLHEDVLHRGIDGRPKRNLSVTKAALTVLYSHQSQPSKLGSQRLNPGNRINTINLTRSARRNGVTPRKIVFSGSFRAIPCKTKTFIPIGGVIIPNSITTILITPHQIGSYPSPVTKG